MIQRKSTINNTDTVNYTLAHIENIKIYQKPININNISIRKERKNENTPTKYH